MATMTIGLNEMGKSGFERFMDGWRHVIQVSERTLIDNVAATVPWLAPVSPAYMAWHNAVTLLGWPVWVAWVVAAAIEGLGLSVISTAFQLWQAGPHPSLPPNTKDVFRGRGKFWVAVVTTVFYLFVVITVNVLLELGFPAWIAKALLSLLSVPAAVTIALRSQNAQIVEQETVKAALQAEELRQAEERARAEKLAEEQRSEQARIDEEARAYARQKDSEERARRHETKMAKIAANQNVLESSVESSGKVMESSKEVSSGDWRNLSIVEKDWIAQATRLEVMKKYGVTSKTAKAWQDKLNGSEESHV